MNKKSIEEILTGVEITSEDSFKEQYSEFLKQCSNFFIQEKAPEIIQKHINDEMRDIPSEHRELMSFANIPRDILETEEQLKEGSYDNLTKLLTRSAIENIQSYLPFQPNNEPFQTSFVMIDYDNFKPINDTLAHAAGDLVLKKGVEIINKYFKRDGDIKIRPGGDELALILPHTSTNEAKKILEQVRKEYNNLSLNWLKEETSQYLDDPEYKKIILKDLVVEHKELTESELEKKANKKIEEEKTKLVEGVETLKNQGYQFSLTMGLYTTDITHNTTSNHIEKYLKKSDELLGQKEHGRKNTIYTKNESTFDPKIKQKCARLIKKGYEEHRNLTPEEQQEILIKAANIFNEHNQYRAIKSAEDILYKINKKK